MGCSRTTRLAAKTALGFASMVALLLGAVPAGAAIPGEGLVREAAGTAGGWAFDKVASGIAGWVLGAVGFFVDGAVGYLSSSTRPDVDAVWFSGPASPYAQVRGMAVGLTVGFVLLALLQGLMAGDGAGMLRVLAGRLPMAVVGTVVTTSVVGRLLMLTDALSDGVLDRTGADAVQFMSGFGRAITASPLGFAGVVIGLVAVIGALLLWVELVVRSSVVYLLVAISPLAFAAMVWPAARGFVRRTAEVLIAVIVSKLVIVIALAIGVAALSGAGQAGAGASPGAGTGEAMATLLTGAVVLGLAAFTPFLIVKLIPVAEAAMVAQGVSRGPLRSAQTGLSSASSLRMITRLSGSSVGGRSGGQSGPGPTGGGAAASASPGGGRGGGPGGGAGGSSGASAGGSGAATGAGAAAGAGLAFVAAAGSKVAGSAARTADATGRSQPAPATQRPNPASTMAPGRPQPGGSR